MVAKTSEFGEATELRALELYSSMVRVSAKVKVTGKFVYRLYIVFQKQHTSKQIFLDNHYWTSKQNDQNQPSREIFANFTLEMIYAWKTFQIGMFYVQFFIFIIELFIIWWMNSKFKKIKWNQLSEAGTFMFAFHRTFQSSSKTFYKIHHLGTVHNSTR